MHQLPSAQAMASMNIDELMSATLRLSDIMQEESVMLKEMRVRDLPALQEEKAKLTIVLEAYQQRLATDPNFIKNADTKTREELVLLADDLAYTVEENFRQVSVARAVNNRVLQAIMDVVSEEHSPGTYGKLGQASTNQRMALSMNLDQKA